MLKTLVITATTDLSSDQRLQRCAAALQAAGWQVTLLGRVLPSSPALPERAFAQVRLRCPVLKGPLFYALFNVQVAFWLLRHKRRMVVAADADTLLAGWVGARLTGAWLAFDAHEYFSELPEVVRRPWVQAAWRWIERRLIPQTDLAYTVGPALAATFERLYGKHFGVVRNVPLASAYQGLERRPVPGRIVYTGAVNEGRGLEPLLEALCRLPAYHVVVCGEGPRLAAIRQMVAELGLDKRVTLMGHLAPEALRLQLAQAWIGFSALEPQGESYRLSLTNKFFDYVQAGLPQICPDLPEYRAILQAHAVGVAVPCRADRIAEAIGQLADPATYRQMEAACPAAAERYCWEREQAALQAMYARFLERE